VLSRPQHVAVDGRRGTVAVVDVFNDRVLVFDDQLRRRVGVVAAPDADRAAGWLTSRVCWINGRLCVAEVQSPDHHSFTAARLTLYDLHSDLTSECFPSGQEGRLDLSAISIC